MTNQLLTKRKLQQATVRYGILLVLLLAGGGYLGLINYQEYQATKTAYENEQNHLAELKGSADKEKRDFIALKKDLDSQNIGVNQSIEKILPSTEEFTNLARELDKYFLNTSGSTSPMFLSDLRFNAAKVDANAEFGLLPFNATINGDENGLKTFLNYVENSGDLNNNSRLLQIGNISLNYQSKDAAISSPTNSNATGNASESSVARPISASLNMNAYFQKPLEDLTTVKK